MNMTQIRAANAAKSNAAKVDSQTISESAAQLVGWISSTSTKVVQGTAPAANTFWKNVQESHKFYSGK